MQVVGEAPRCPECGGSVVEDSTEEVCTACGTVIVGVFHTGPEWNAYSPEQAAEKARTGPPMTLRLHDGGLATVVGDARNGKKSLDIDERQKLYALRKWQARSRISEPSDGTLTTGLSELTKMAATLGLPRAANDTASILYRRAIKKRLIRGRSVTNMIAAAIYMSCRQCGVPRTLDEIATLAMVDKKVLGRSFRFLFHSLEQFVPPSAPRTYAAKFANRLNLSGKAEGMAIRILEKAHEMRLTSGRGPAGIAAASTYIATVLTNERKTQREIAEIANVTEVTIRNRYKELLQKLMIEVPL